MPEKKYNKATKVWKSTYKNDQTYTTSHKNIYIDKFSHKRIKNHNENKISNNYYLFTIIFVYSITNIMKLF